MTKTRKIDKYDYEPFYDGTSQSLETGSNTVKCTGYRVSKCKAFWANCFGIMTVGLINIFLRWYPAYKASLKYSKTMLDRADVVLIEDKAHINTLCAVKTEPLRHFDYKMQRFVWDASVKSYILLVGVKGEVQDIIERSKGVSPEERQIRLEIHGKNTMVVEIKSFFKLLLDEVLNPFYLFEMASVILWIFDEYYHYAFCVIILSGSAIIISLYQARKQNKVFKNMVSCFDNSFSTIIDEYGREQVISCSDLVPFDVLKIPPQGCILPCDALLLTGTCIVNESVLTGESIPVTKVPALRVNEEYEPNGAHSKHTLYCGTHCIQTRYYSHEKVLALVVRTGSSTAKGQLVRSVMYPKQFGFDFYSEAIKLVEVLFGIASLGVILSAEIFIDRGASLETILLRSLDIMTIIVPPALPAAVTVGTIYAKTRLQKQGIHCTSPARINVCGKVKLVCFDKTGTLTEEGLSVWGVLTSNGKSLENIEEKPNSLSIMSPVLHVMTSCHSLTKIDGQLCGDPLDLSMFESTDWELEEPGNETNRFDQLAPTVVRPKENKFVNVASNGDGNSTSTFPLEIGIVRQFHFNSIAQCMSVITRTLGSKCMVVYTKGAPEKVVEKCDQKTLPDNLTITLSYYTSAGYRVIALAYKSLPRKFNWLQAQRVAREVVECDLEFLGLLVMKNTLKPQSALVINQLQQARIKCLMLTGDNMLTAVSVSRNCGLLPPTVPLSQVKISTTSPRTIKLNPLHSSSDRTETDVSSALAIDGSTWKDLCEFFPGLVPQVATRSVIFARMSPQQKAQVVETLQSLDYIVAMVGDGANDCGALKTAHIGISLSSAEASIAAPFTSTTPDVTCVPKLITEGRCALVTNFSMFNFMSTLGLIQFSSVLMLYLEGLEMGTMQFLYVDLVIMSSLAIVMGRSKPEEKLVPKRPISSLLSMSNLIPLLLQIFLAVCVQFVALEILKNEPWYEHTERAVGDDYKAEGWENTTIFIISCYQFIILAVSFNKGRPHRQPTYKNFWFMFNVLCLVATTSFLLMNPFEEVSEFFELQKFYLNDTFKFRLVLICLAVVNLVLALMIEHTVAQSTWFKWSLNKIRRKKVFKNKYKTLENQILSSRVWWEPLSV